VEVAAPGFLSRLSPQVSAAVLAAVFFMPCARAAGISCASYCFEWSHAAHVACVTAFYEEYAGAAAYNECTRLLRERTLEGCAPCSARPSAFALEIRGEDLVVHRTGEFAGRMRRVVVWIALALACAMVLIWTFPRGSNGN
jgi:hypothetical protein